MQNEMYSASVDWFNLDKVYINSSPNTINWSTHPTHLSNEGRMMSKLFWIYEMVAG